MSISSIVSFDVKVVGDESETTYEGVFESKTKLSLRERLKEDELRRLHLGMDSANASQDAFVIASALAFLGVRVTKAPKWWTDANNGADLVDMNVVGEIHKLCSAAIAKEYEKLSKQATEAQKELKADQPKV